MTERSNTEDAVDSGTGLEAEAGADIPLRSAGGMRAGRLSLFAAAMALVVGVAAMAIHIQPQLLGPMATPTSDPTSQRAALELLGNRIDSVQSRLAEILKSLEVLQVRQESLSTMAGQMDALSQEMDLVAGRLDSARHRIDGVAAGVRDADVRERVEWLTGQIRELETAFGGGESDAAQVEERLAVILTELGKRLDTIAVRTRRLEVMNPDRVAGAAAVALAVGQLRMSILDGQPYSAPLVNVKTLLATEGTPPPDISALLTALEREASVGVMTMVALQQRLSDRSSVILQAGTSEATRWIDQILRRLATVVTVRRTGEVSGTGTEAHLARAEVRLHEGKLDAAVAEMLGLKGASADAAASWLDAAQVRLAVESALSKLEGYAVSRIADIYETTQIDRTIQ